ncbi:membrane alanyl aminopeptidase-like [Papilio machaon]|uniref:membrane alanyl aminopeptidase-like n=1 Tax=Papilio machaon TaxID=76193 RepID=UPI001E665C48|nr:membrane alanyl aminopeptidase-like [Papilio machaon]
MATLKLLVLLASCLVAHAIPQSPPISRSTIFGDERLKGEIFENVDAYSNEVALGERNVNAIAYRLPNTTKPESYVVLWVVDTTNLLFEGTVDISLVANQANVNEIVIHAHDLNITSLVLRLNNVIQPTIYSFEPEYHFLRIRLSSNAMQYNPTNPVRYTLSIAFRAPLRDDMYGIYRSWFRNRSTDPIRWMATTQFQATAARFAFPCYDEPSFKATFNITIRRPVTHRSWSCTRIRQTVNSPNTLYQDDIYYQTPVMSTYLLALIVAEYHSLSVLENGNLTYEVIARQGAIEANQGQYAFDVGQELLAEMNNHTALNFRSMNPYLKMTQASIPDFSAGAMENWGLLTYREAYLMYDPAHTNDYYKQLIAYILSHEIAHMWFGNLVTCDWWGVLWLNEGFARYYQYFLTDWVEDYMGLGTRFITEQVHTALLADAADNPHPLTTPGIGSAVAVRTMFSTISYNKGAAVIRMTEHFLGFDVHREGLRNYLVERAYSTAQPIHLFRNLESVGISSGSLAAYGSDFNFIEYYESWTEQPGHPVLLVNVNHQNGDMTIIQRRFNINTGYSSVNTNWIIPITFATASNRNFADTKPTHIIRKAVTVINRNSIGDEWVIFNKQQTGFYRVLYDDYTWDLITLALRGPDRLQIHEYNRAQIVNDVFQFARSGLMNYTKAFSILSFLENETEYTPWVAALTGFSWIRNRFRGTPLLAQTEATMVRWSATAIRNLTYYPQANESFMRSYLRYQLAPVLCAMNVQECRTAANAQFRALINNGIEVPVNSRNWVYCNALRDGSQADFNFLWTRFQNHNVYTEKILLLSVLGCTPHAASLNTFLTAIVQDNFIVRPQDYTTAWNSATTGNEGNTQIVFNFVRNNLQTVINAFGSASVPLSYISSRLRTEAEIVEFQTWADQNRAALGDDYQSVYNGAEASRNSIRWAAAVASDFNNYFVNGDTPIVLTTTTRAPATTVPTVTAPPVVEPTTPTLPSSAMTSFVSLSALLLVIVNFII